MESKQDRFFKGLHFTTVQTSGGPCDLPVLYPSSKMLCLMYRVEPRRAAKIIGDRPLEPFVMFGRAPVLLALFEHRDSGLGTYNEISLGIQIKQRGSSPSVLRFLYDMRSQEETGFYIANLPVTTERACSGGIDIWGLPKYVTGIDAAFLPGQVQGALQNEFEVTCVQGPGISFRSLPLVIYSVRSDRLLRTVVEIGSTCRYWRGNRTDIKIRGSGPTADNLRTLGIDALKPVLALRGDAGFGYLPQGTDRGET